jgi:hypothetical protein
VNHDAPWSFGSGALFLIQDPNAFDSASAADYGVTHQSISRIRREKSWRDAA